MPIPLTLIPCEVREELERKIADAYKELWDSQTASDKPSVEARAKVDRLLIQKHSHERKHGCLRDGQ
jgi:hypothetical protein